MHSELSIDVLEGLLDAPKPMHIYFGGKTKNCLELDITKCRRRALEHSCSEFPEACVLDTIQDYTGGEEFDFAYVDAGPPDMTYFRTIVSIVDLGGTTMNCFRMQALRHGKR